MLYITFNWKWPCGSVGEMKELPEKFHHFSIIFTWNREWSRSLIYINLHPSWPMMLYFNFGWYRPSRLSYTILRNLNLRFLLFDIISPYFYNNLEISLPENLFFHMWWHFAFHSWERKKLSTMATTVDKWMLWPENKLKKGMRVAISSSCYNPAYTQGFKLLLGSLRAISWVLFLTFWSFSFWASWKSIAEYDEREFQWITVW